MINILNMHESTAADIILNIIKANVVDINNPNNPYDVVLLEYIYTNCRENGYHLRNDFLDGKDRAVSFSQNRNSDDIVVYCGHINDFAFNTNIPNEECYKNAKYFKYNEHLEAAQYIVIFLLG